MTAVAAGGIATMPLPHQGPKRHALVTMSGRASEGRAAAAAAMTVAAEGGIATVFDLINGCTYHRRSKSFCSTVIPESLSGRAYEARAAVVPTFSIARI